MPVKIVAISKLRSLALLGASCLLVSTQLLAEERADVLERIAPVGKVAVEGQAAPAVAAPVAEETAPAAEETMASAEAAAPAVEEAAAPAAAPAPAAAGGDQLALATTSGCMACHQIEVKVVGPAYKEVAAKYKGDAGAVDALVEKVKSGGVGTWGQIPMPPNLHVPEENIRAVVAWILTL